MVLNHKTVLVTGATGFVASHLIPELLLMQAKVVGIASGKGSIPGCSFFRADIRNRRKLSEILRKTKPDVVFHLAALQDAPLNVSNPQDYVSVNIAGTLNLISLLGDVEAFVHTGSYKEYHGNAIPFRESQPLSPLSLYAVSKAATEMFGISLHRLSGMPFTSLRFPLLYGPRQPEGSFLTVLIRAAMRNAAFPISGGRQTRELLYISDAIDALVKAASLKKTAGRVLNVGSDKELSIREVVRVVLRLADSSARPQWGKIPYRENEIFRMRGNSSIARKLLNWKPRISLEEGLKRTIADIAHA